jgi:parvulin-like peptidyl-prolyl isomerase
MAFSFSRRLPAPLFTVKALLGLPIALLVGAALLTTGCHPRVTDPKDPKFIVAEKGTWTITRGDLDNEIGSYLQQHQMTMDQVPPAKIPQLETFMLDNMVLKKLLLEKAATMDLKDVDKDVNAQIDEIKGRVPPGQDLNAELKSVGLTMDDLKARIHDQVVISKVLEADAFQHTTATEAEVSDFYMKNKDKFNVAPQVRASRVLVLVDTKATPEQKAAKKKIIDKAHDRVVKGEEFSKVATEVSEDQYSKARGGDLSWFKQGETGETELEAVAFSSKTGVISAVFESPMGYEFIKVTDTKPGGVATLADATPTISKYLTELKQRQQEEAYTNKLLADSDVKFYLTRVDLHAAAAQAAGAPPADAQGGAPAPDAQGGAPDAQAPAAPAPAPDAQSQAPVPVAPPAPAPAPSK